MLQPQLMLKSKVSFDILWPQIYTFFFFFFFWFLDCTSPFEVNVVTDATTDVVAATIASSNVGNDSKYCIQTQKYEIPTKSILLFLGVCLEYTQEPCSAGNPGP